jgi:carboxyl-terminal processing protease
VVHLELTMFRTLYWFGPFVLVGVLVVVGMHPQGRGSVPPPSATALPTTISPAAKDYLYKALINMERDSLMGSQVDWTAIQHQALEYAGNAQTYEETYPAIRYALEQLDDHHSFFLDHDGLTSLQDGKSPGWGLVALFPERVVAQVYPDSPAALAGIQVGGVIAAVDGRPPHGLDGEVQLPSDSSVSLTLEGAPADPSRTVMLNRTDYNTDLKPQGRRLPGALGYIELSGVNGEEMQDRYGDIAQGLIRQMDYPPACGWVVDLRRNRGGIMRVMLLGIGPILGEGQVGAYVDRQDRRNVWSYSGGSAHADGWARLEEGAEPYTINHPGAPVAVLTSRLTTSAGEAIVVAFRGRPNTRSFGEATFGVPTHNIVDPLLDGAWLVITNAFDVDRAGHTYSDKIMPDQVVAADWRDYASDRDPVLRAATDWLHHQAACAS